MAPNVFFSFVLFLFSGARAVFLLSGYRSSLLSLLAHHLTPPPFLTLRFLTLLLIRKHTGAISADLQPTPAPWSIHPLPRVAISPSLPSFSLCCWSKVALCWAPLGEQRQRAAAVLKKVTVMYGHRRCRRGRARLNGHALNTHTGKSITAFWKKCMLSWLCLEGNTTQCSHDKVNFIGGWKLPLPQSQHTELSPQRLNFNRNIP